MYPYIPHGGTGPEVPPPPSPAGGYGYATPSAPGGIPLGYATPYAGNMAQLPFYQGHSPYYPGPPLPHSHTPPPPQHGYFPTQHYQSTPAAPYGYLPQYTAPPSPRSGYQPQHVYDYTPGAYVAASAQPHGNSPFIPPLPFDLNARDEEREFQEAKGWRQIHKSPRRSPMMQQLPEMAPGYAGYGWQYNAPIPPPPPPPPVQMSPQFQQPQLSTLIAAAVAEAVQMTYDLRYDYQTAIFRAPGTPRVVSLSQCFSTIATNPAVPSMRIICPDFPWVITVTASGRHGVNVGDVLETVYTELQKPITNAEWWIAAPSTRDRILKNWHESLEEQLEDAEGREGKAKKKYKRRSMLAEIEARRQAGIKRVDWLIDKTMWSGLVGSHAVIDERLNNWGNSQEATYALLLR